MRPPTPAPGSPVTSETRAWIADRLADAAERWLEDFAFGRPEPELRRLEAAFRAAFGWQVPLAESTRAALEREYYDMFGYGL